MIIMGVQVKKNNIKPSTTPVAERKDFHPLWILDIEIGNPIPDISPTNPANGKTYQRCRMLVRLHGQPIGVVELSFGRAGISGQEVASAIWANLTREIQVHLKADGCPVPSYLSKSGIICSSEPRCKQEIDSFMVSAPPASIVIATHNRTESLAETLNSILQLSYPHFEIIVVDNAPNSTTTAEFIHQNYGGKPQVKYVREDFAGLAAAHNAGLLEVTSPFVAFTDDDVLVDRYWLVRLIRGFFSADRVSCVTGLIFPYEVETIAQEWIEQYGGFAKGFHPVIFDNKEYRINHPLFPYAAGWFGSGASMAFKTDYLKGVGGFDPATGAGTPAQGGDDLSAFFQVINDGYQLVYEPRSLLYHKHRREYIGLQQQAYGYGVGLTAYLTKTLLEHPRRLVTIAVKLPSGLAYLLSAKSKKNIKKKSGYPKELNHLEMRGMLHGPVAYFRSRQRARDAGIYWVRKDELERTSLVKNGKPEHKAE